MAKIVLATWDGGGVVPPLMQVARRLGQRGHDVRVLADPTIGDEARAAGCSFRAWKEAPHRSSRDRRDDILRDYAATNKLRYLKEEVGGYFFRKGDAWTRDILATIDEHGAEAVLCDSFVLWGVVAAEARGIPSAALFTMPYYVPQPGMTPSMSSLLPVPRPLRGIRDALLRWVVHHVHDGFRVDVNRVRASYKLAPVAHTLDQITRADAQIVLGSRAFDFGGAGAPAGLHWAGPQLEDPSWTDAWTSPWSADDDRPLVVVGMSSTFQDHAALLQRVVDALVGLPVRALVTRGPTIREDEVRGRDNVAVRASVPHQAVLRDATILVTHAGHGTTLKALAHGVPMLCIPQGRDQDANAARVVALGAGLELKPKAATAVAIRQAIERMLRTPSFRACARVMAATIDRREGETDAVDVIESLLPPRDEAQRGTLPDRNNLVALEEA